jgi:hypothetical protein
MTILKQARSFISTLIPIPQNGADFERDFVDFHTNDVKLLTDQFRCRDDANSHAKNFENLKFVRLAFFMRNRF